VPAHALMHRGGTHELRCETGKACGSLREILAAGIGGKTLGMPNLLLGSLSSIKGDAMNRFKVPKGSEQAFEELWLFRETHLDGNPRFCCFPPRVGASFSRL
jgi:hypothetical protein